MEEKMKRVKAACICQTLHFMLKEDISHEDAVRFVAEEVAHYKKSLERNRTQYKIVEETTQPDGSIMIKIKKQYNQSPVGDYLNEKETGGCRILRLLRSKGKRVANGVNPALVTRFLCGRNFWMPPHKSVPLWMRTRRRFYNLEENRKWKKNRMHFWRGSLSES